jgi:cytoskeletal protein RodZ
MEALGEYLKEAREKLNLSIDKIADDTHIMKKFIEAIEIEEFTAFPGEAYLKGFLRTYSEYLGIDAEGVIRRYEKIKMIETPTPIEQLIPKPKFNFRPFIVIFVIILILAGIGVGGFFGVKAIITVIAENQAKAPKPQKVVKKPVADKPEKTEKAEKATDNTADTEEETVAENTEDNKVQKEAERKQKEKANKKDKNNKQAEPEVVKEDITELTEPVTHLAKVKQNAIIKLNINEKEYSMKVKQLSPTVVIDYADKELYVMKDMPHKLDLNADDRNDLELVLNGWDKDFADITIKTIDQTIVSTATVGTMELVGDNPEILVTRDTPEEISLVINVTAEQFIRYKADDKDSVEDIYAAGATATVRAKSYAIVWLTNSAMASFTFPRFENKVYNFNSDRRVEIRLIKWERNGEGKYELIVSTLK